MRTIKLKYLYFVFFLLSELLAFSVNDSLVNTLDFTRKKSKSGRTYNFSLSGNETKSNINLKWLYFPYDNASIKEKQFNDSGYIPLKQTLLYLLDDEDSRADTFPFEGIAWYKTYFRIPSQKKKNIYSITFSQLGASEIYLDGELLNSFGEIYPDGKTKTSVKTDREDISFYINDTLIHVLAVRYSSSDYKELREKYDHTEIGPEITFNDAGGINNDHDLVSVFYSVTNMLAAFFMALFVIHLLIYLFYREKNFNLLYALFLLFLALSFFELYFVRFIHDSRTYLWVTNIDGLFFPACCFFLVTLLNKLLNVKLSKHYIIFAVAFGVLILDTFFSWGIGSPIATSMGFYSYFNTLAHAIVGIKRKIPSSKFLGWGVLSFSISFLVAILFAIILSMFNGSPNSNIFVTFLISDVIIGILSIPLSMTAYLAYDFARTNKSLTAQLETNQELSRKTIRQEKEKQELLANQNKVLETQVYERTKEIATQNKVLETQKKEITDSINYAKRIQQSMLPPLEEIYECLNEAFVLFRPKDIVSGDFYWFHKSADKEIFIAAADCTGHGVPGAIMSMLGTEKLNEAAVKSNDVSTILSLVNRGVKKSLRQSGSDNSTRDGMDIALCSFNSQMTELNYTGANRPLWIIRKGTLVIEEIKATKTAIGGTTEDEQIFEQHRIKIQKGDALYIFSDGYADQFSPEDKKLMTRKFKEIILGIQNLSINEQKDYLDDFMTNWKGNMEQTDDILVIGVKV